MAYSTDRLGDLLVRAGLLTPEQLDAALLRQAETHLKLGEVLVRDLVLTEDQIARVLAEQKGYEHVNLAAYPIDRAATVLLPLRMARRRSIIPVRFDGETLTLAMADPLDIEAIDETEMLTGMRVEPVVASASQVRYAVEKYVAGADALQQLAVMGEEPEPEEEQGGDEEASAAVVRMVNQIVREAVLENASDIHFEPVDGGVRIRYRVDGVLREAAMLPRSARAETLSRLKVMADLDISDRRRPQDGRIAVRVGNKILDLRVATLPTPSGESITLRVLDKEAAFRPLADIGLGEEALATLRGMLRKPYGALFISGPTGSGKSTTLYAILSEMQDLGRKFITIEDPIEYTMDGVTQIAVNVRTGLTFSAGLRSILRSDPDVVLVGEVRDAETAEIAVRAALTGHLMLTSIHTNDAASVLTRLSDMGIPPYIVSSGLIGAVAQRLVRRLCERCKVQLDVDGALLRDAGFEEAELYGLTIFGPVGCEACGGSGYRGRVGVFEVMEFSDELRRMFIHKAPAEELRKEALCAGMRTLRRDALDKVKSGVTSLDELNRVVV